MKKPIFFTALSIILIVIAYYIYQEMEKKLRFKEEIATMVQFVEEKKAECNTKEFNQERVIYQAEKLFNEYSKYVNHDDENQMQFGIIFFIQTGNICNDVNIDELKQLQNKIINENK